MSSVNTLGFLVVKSKVTDTYYTFSLKRHSYDYRKHFGRRDMNKIVIVGLWRIKNLKPL